MERKLASQTLSNPSSLGLEVFPADSGDVTITLTLSGVLKTIAQVQGQQAVDDLNNTYRKLIYSPKCQFIYNLQEGWRQRRWSDVGDC